MLGKLSLLKFSQITNNSIRLNTNKTEPKITDFFAIFPRNCRATCVLSSDKVTFG